MKVTGNIMDIKDHYLSEFEVFAELYGKQKNSLRKMAINEFATIGFPDRKHEEWKYTNLTSLLSETFSIAKPSHHHTISAEQINKYKVLGEGAIVLVFVNGIYSKEFSDQPSEKGLEILPISSSYNHPQFANYFAKQAAIMNESFVSLNTAFFSDGCFVSVADGANISKPIHILHVADSTGDHTAAFPRNLFVMGKNSKAQIIASYHAVIGNYRSFTNAVNEIIVGENAQLEFDIKQNEPEGASHINYTEVLQHKNSNFNISTITLNGSLVRNNLHIVLAEVNCTAHLHGLSIADNQQMIDNHTLVDHASPNCYSNELYKSILGGKAQGVFNGKIFVRKDAQKTNAYQSNKNILLTDEAVMNAKPQLEIFADDVKCSHGATTGQLDEDALFYLRARGIGKDDAKALLNFAFASDVLSHINNEALRNNLLQLLSRKLNSHIEFDLD